MSVLVICKINLMAMAKVTKKSKWGCKNENLILLLQRIFKI